MWCVVSRLCAPARSLVCRGACACDSCVARSPCSIPRVSPRGCGLQDGGVVCGLWFHMHQVSAAAPWCDLGGFPVVSWVCLAFCVPCAGVQRCTLRVTCACPVRRVTGAGRACRMKLAPASRGCVSCPSSAECKHARAICNPHAPARVCVSHGPRASSGCHVRDAPAGAVGREHPLGTVCGMWSVWCG